jgi:uncharacterized membrane protein
VKILQMLSLISLGSIFSVLALYRYFVDPLASLLASTAVLVLQVAPLLLLVFGVIFLRSRQIFYLAIISLLYFIHGVVQVVDPGSRAFGLAEAVFAILLCVTTSYLVKNLGLSTKVEVNSKMG